MPRSCVAQICSIAHLCTVCGATCARTMRACSARRRRGPPPVPEGLEKNFSADAADGPISARFAQNCATLRRRARTRSGVDRARCDANRIGKTLSVGIDFLFLSHSSTLRFRTAAVVRRHEKQRRCFANQNAQRRRAAHPPYRPLPRSCSPEQYSDDRATPAVAPVEHAASEIWRTPPPEHMRTRELHRSGQALASGGSHDLSTRMCGRAHWWAALARRRRMLRRPAMPGKILGCR